MDPFTQRMLEKAEQRSRALGISSTDASKFPCGDANTSSSSMASSMSTGSSSGACATTTALASHQQQQPQKQQLPLHASSGSGNVNKLLHVIEKSGGQMDTRMAKNASSKSGDNGGGSPRKVLRQFSAVDKENMDLGIEINIMTDKNVEVQVQVEEQEITDDEDYQKQMATIGHAAAEGSQQTIEQIPCAAKIRDTSRNRLQRLGALYSEKDDLSSPIHRTEANFHADNKDDTDLDGQLRKPKQRLGKLAALASTINQWEDDITHHGPTMIPEVIKVVPPPKPDLPSRRRTRPEGHGKDQAPQPPESQKPKSPKTHVTPKSPKSQAPQPPQIQNPKPKIAPKSPKAQDSMASKAQEKDHKPKQLKWDPNVLSSLEAQGFQRRESSTVKVSYDFKDDNQGQQEDSTSRSNDNLKEEKRVVGKLDTTKFNALATNSLEKKQTQQTTEKKLPTVKTGMVSGRAAVFEAQVQANQQQQKPQKDPTELSLKERMKLFEKNKGEALVPKAAFGMAPPISKILQDSHKKEEHIKVPSTSVVSGTSVNHGPVMVKTKTDNKLRDKVAAIFGATSSENRIKEDIRKQREEEMQLLANRFNKQKEIFSQSQQQQGSPKDQDSRLAHHSQVKTTVMAAEVNTTLQRPHALPPPPPPPLPPSGHSQTTKRRSPGDAIDDDDVTKRARTKRLYPALSDLESNESCSDNEMNYCNAATVSVLSTADEMKASMQPLRGGDSHVVAHIEQDDDNEDSYMETETEDSSVGICNGSLGREIMQVVQKNDKQLANIKEVRYAEEKQYFGEANGGDSSLNSSEASMDGMDDYLDEALEDNEEDDGDDDITQDEDDDEDDGDNSRLSKGSKCTTASNSFSFRKANTPNRRSNCQTIREETTEEHHTTTTTTTTATDTSSGGNGSSYMHPVKSELSINKENENVVTLVHTVSFYRRQQTANSANSTPIRKICREQQVLRSAMEKLENKGVGEQVHFIHEPEESDEDSQSDSEQNDAHLVQEKIKKLLEEVCKQQQVIAQTSQALNLCAATIEFSGSTESVEGERHLLVATHRRQACLDEVQRLRVEKSVRPLGAPREKGRLTVKEITVPLRQDYIRKLAADTISGHHLVCLLKYNEHVLATKTVPTLPGLLAVKFPDVMQLNNVYADFKVTLEIYGMTAQREVLPHEVKYHINLNKKCGVKTPKKKGSDNRLVMPPVQSPAGPHVVRTPALVQYGFAIFSLREIQRTTWTLTQVLGVSPLEGVVHMKVNCELSVSVEYKGFLTMFEDISGFGAWHRRWCHLNGTMLNYWKYPDDEKKKTPMGSIDLYTCSSQKVCTAPRDICARLNTMLLECQRPARETDQESLVIVPNGRTTTVRYLLSADTKEEREEWCAYFNKALTLLRAWGPPQ
ncbi:anillin, actin binding protein isoform X2 [Haematobia irritans]|uniref:anillin, actin binding protein isoform X2 n=1 Tax=Haematobia irritans TaxID=7368 RepID=UPI003F501547